MTKASSRNSRSNELPDHALSRRERQIMDVIYASKEATAAQVHAALPDAPSYSAVRATLRILEEKGHLRHENQGKVYLYRPVRARGQAARSKLRQVVETFFAGSVEQAVATLISTPETKLSDEELDRLSELIDQAKKENR